MKMTLEEAKKCLEPMMNNCKNCKFNNQGEFDCRGTALEMGASALNYLLLGGKLAAEEEEKEPFKPMVEIDLYSVIKQKYIEREVLDEIDEIITDALDKSTDQKESQTLRWVLDKISEMT